MTDENAGGVAKRFLYVNRRAPYGSIYALESLEVVLIGAAFEQDVSLAFLGDGVYQLTKGQDTRGLWSNGDVLTVCSILLVLRSSGSRPGLP